MSIHDETSKQQLVAWLVSEIAIPFDPANRCANALFAKDIKSVETLKLALQRNADSDDIRSQLSTAVSDEVHVALIYEKLGIDSSAKESETSTLLLPSLSPLPSEQPEVDAALQLELWNAAWDGNASAVLRCIESGKVDIDANISIPRSYRNGTNALIAASMFGYSEIVTTLLENRANINATNKRGATALIVACGNSHTKKSENASIIATLLDNRADLSIASKDGKTALHLASFWGHTTSVAALLATGRADLSAVDKEGKTALQLATESGHTETVALLQAAI